MQTASQCRCIPIASNDIPNGRTERSVFLGHVSYASTDTSPYVKPSVVRIREPVDEIIRWYVPTGEYVAVILQHLSYCAANSFGLGWVLLLVHIDIPGKGPSRESS